MASAIATTAKRMRLYTFRSLWGTTAPQTKKFDQLFASLKAKGYSGIECSLGDTATTNNVERAQFRQLLNKHDLKMIAGVYSSWVDYTGRSDASDQSMTKHIELLKKQVECALEFDPIHINAHSGADSWNDHQNREFFGAVMQQIYKPLLPHIDLSPPPKPQKPAKKIAATPAPPTANAASETVAPTTDAAAPAPASDTPPQPIAASRGPTISHETHRGRSFFNPFATARVLAEYPQLRLTADFSHWSVVCERLFEGSRDSEILKRLCAHVSHIHARVGSPQRAQIPHRFGPGSEQLANEITRHRRWWQWIWAAQREQGFTHTTLTPEYGPPPYQHVATAISTADTAAAATASAALELELDSMIDGERQSCVEQYESWSAAPTKAALHGITRFPFKAAPAPRTPKEPKQSKAAEAESGGPFAATTKPSTERAPERRARFPKRPIGPSAKPKRSDAKPNPHLNPPANSLPRFKPHPKHTPPGLPPLPPLQTN